MKPLDFPNNIQIQTTSRCNAGCVFCPYPHLSRELPQGTMDEGLFRTIIDQLSGYPIDLIQPFLMNDPLMDKNILERLEYIIRKNPHSGVNITTNGALLNPGFARELVRLNLDSIHISSNGLIKDTYSKTMGIDGFDVLRNVNYLWDLIRRGGYKTKLYITSIFLKNTKEEIFLAKKYWQSRGIAFFMNPLNNRAGNINPECFQKMLPFEGKTNSDHLQSYQMSGCVSLFSFMGILYNGDLVSCCMDWHRHKVLGNARENSLYDIWHGMAYNEMRHLSNSGCLDKLSLCKNCGENRFSIDEKSLRKFIEHQETDELKTDIEVARKFIKANKTEPDIMKLSIVRP